MTVAVSVPSRDERLRAYRNATWLERIATHEAIATHKAAAITARRALGRRYLAQHPAGIVVPFERATLGVDLKTETRDAREEAVALARDRASQHESGSLQYPLLAKDFAERSACVRFALSPLLLAPIIRYCGMLPVLFNMFVTRAYQNDVKDDSPHRFHLDPEDTISFKVFVHLTDVDKDCGPFHTLPADLTAQVLRSVGYSGIRFLPDEDVDRIVGLENVVAFTGPPGTAVFADTTRCLHFGGRPRASGKPQRDMLVFQYLLPTSLLFPIDGDAKHPRFLPQLEPRGDDTWDALIGTTHT